MRQRVVALLAVSLAALGSGLGASPAGAAPAVDRLAVSVVGDGETGGNRAVPVSILSLGGDGTRGDVRTLPTAADGDQHAFTLGADRDQQGALRQSADHRFLTIGGYDAEPGDLALNDTAAPDTLRVVARIDAAGAVDTSTSLADGYSLRHLRGVASDDGTRHWTGGHGHDAPATRAGVLSVEHGGAAPTPVVAGSSELNNARVPLIHDGQLYVSSDRTGFHGVNQVGSGLPTTAADLTPVASAPDGASVPHDFVFVGDTLYVGYTEGSAPGLAKYVRRDGSWAYVGSHPGVFWGLTGRVAGERTVLYAVRGGGQGNEVVRLLDEGADTWEVVEERTLATADAGTAFRGIAFAAGFAPGTDPIESEGPTPAVGWTPRVAGGTGNALSAVLDAAGNPVARGRVADPAGAELTVTATSADPSVVADDGLTVRVEEDGTFALSATPRSAGASVITVTATAADGRQGTARLDYRVSAALPDAGVRAHPGMSDASASYAVGDGHFVVADDDSNQFRLYGGGFAEPIATFDLTERVPAVRSGDTWDIEGAARAGNTIYWVGSLGNTNSGNIRLDRDLVIATAVHGSGADTTLEYVGHARGLRQALVDGDMADVHGLGADHFGFRAATQDGVSARGPNSLNVEGATIAPDGTTLWLGFRSPLVALNSGGDGDGDSDGDKALVVGIPDIAGVVAGTTEPRFGDVVRLDLDGHAIRDLQETDDGGYLIIGGSTDDGGDFDLYGWTGRPEDAPVRSATSPTPPAGWEGGSFEALLDTSGLADGTTVRLVQDAGNVDIYGDGTPGEDLPAAELRKFLTLEYRLDFGGAFPGEPAEESPRPGGPEGPGDDNRPDDDENAAGTDDQESEAAGGDGDLAGTGAGTILVVAALAALLVLGGGTALLIRRGTLPRGPWPSA
ncbi:hypothetical protein [Streptomyces profundus]|uniref:hypothetical protein n=1 Tax=Streptomyces profundus TaxID=2867410 RepID=UPI001D16911B|nr:hypothetical protein [Streptomyces sp. MA3_2.13]UED83510.1 hypothetical protein K4G22_04240 [Streptomyces sp. MA3_2.13]